jgi:hypothetical protein
MMFENTSSLHSTLFPIAFVYVSITPFHFADLMIAAFLKSTLVCKLSWNCQLALTLLSIFVPAPLNV